MAQLNKKETTYNRLTRIALAIRTDLLERSTIGEKIDAWHACLFEAVILSIDLIIKFRARQTFDHLIDLVIGRTEE